jgi:hypothetical protein
MKKITLLLLISILSFATALAQDAYTILSEENITAKAKIGGVTLGSREVKQIVYEYPSTDADGKAVTISGVIMAPADVVDGTVPCDGVIMYNHPTIGSPNDAVSVFGEAYDALPIFLASPLKPNYIVVASDYIGYGSSIDHDVSYIGGDTNGRNCLDGLLAAFQLFKDKEMPTGRFLFTLGYSQGGTESMYAAKLTDTEEKYKNIRFDKVFSGGGCLDIEKAYRIYLENDHCEDLNDVVMMITSVNENYHLGIPYDVIFKEPVASKALEYFHSKDKSVMSEIGVNSLEKVSDIITPEFLDFENEYAKRFMDKLKDISITNGWTPDVTKKYFLTHSRHDNYVPIQAGRGLLNWMKENGFTPSIVPGKTSLQTDYIIFKLKHQQAAIVWAIQSLAAIQFWPVLYYEGEQNRYYNNIVKDLNLLKVVKFLESIGIDLHKIVSGEGLSRSNLPDRYTLFDFISGIDKILAKVDLTTDDLEEMCEDSGITQVDILQAVAYVQTGEDPLATAPAANLEENVEAPLFLLRYYEQQLANWFMLAGYDVNYSLWGM